MIDTTEIRREKTDLEKFCNRLEKTLQRKNGEIIYLQAQESDYQYLKELYTQCAVVVSKQKRRISRDDFDRAVKKQERRQGQVSPITKKLTAKLNKTCEKSEERIVSLKGNVQKLADKREVCNFETLRLWKTH